MAAEYPPFSIMTRGEWRKEVATAIAERDLARNCQRKYEQERDEARAFAQKQYDKARKLERELDKWRCAYQQAAQNNLKRAERLDELEAELEIAKAEVNAYKYGYDNEKRLRNAAEKRVRELEGALRRVDNVTRFYGHEFSEARAIAKEATAKRDDWKCAYQQAAQNNLKRAERLDELEAGLDAIVDDLNQCIKNREIDAINRGAIHDQLDVARSRVTQLETILTATHEQLYNTTLNWRERCISAIEMIERAQGKLE